MFEIFKNVIEKKEYDLREMLYKINKSYVENYITEEQKESLEELARRNAIAENSYAPLQKQIDDLVKRVEALENKDTSAGTETEEYPEYVQPTGAHDAYNVKDKVTYEGKKYECIMNNCVWSPGEYPAGWVEITE